MARLHKTEQDLESRILRTIGGFKKFHPCPEDLEVATIIKHINGLFDIVAKCPLSRTVVQIFSVMLAAFMRMNKSQVSEIIHSFMPIFEQCVTEKKKHHMKAIFLASFESFPEISWAFHTPLVKFLEPCQPEHVQNQAICILRKILTSQAIKNIVNLKDQDKDQSGLVSRSEVLEFVESFGQTIREVLAKNSDSLQDHPKNSALFIGCASDCLKLVGASFYQV